MPESLLPGDDDLGSSFEAIEVLDEIALCQPGRQRPLDRLAGLDHVGIHALPYASSLERHPWHEYHISVDLSGNLDDRKHPRLQLVVEVVYRNLHVHHARQLIDDRTDRADRTLNGLFQCGHVQADLLADPYLLQIRFQHTHFRTNDIHIDQLEHRYSRRSQIPLFQMSD